MDESGAGWGGWDGGPPLLPAPQPIPVFHHRPSQHSKTPKTTHLARKHSREEAGTGTFPGFRGPSPLDQGWRWSFQKILPDPQGSHIPPSIPSNSLPTPHLGSWRWNFQQILPDPQASHQSHPSHPAFPGILSQFLTWGVPLSPSCSRAWPSSTPEHRMDLISRNSARQVGWEGGIHWEFDPC